VVHGHLETLLDEARRRNDEGYGYPRFVEHEFRRYLDCGLLARGFARLRCPECGFERLVAFSCKGRICPPAIGRSTGTSSRARSLRSLRAKPGPRCWARRAADTAAHLVDHVLPEARWRQWVLTFPFEVRFLLQVDPLFLSEMLTGFLRILFAWMRRRARAAGARGGEPGSVTFVQRFGCIWNLNPHFHVLCPDGVFEESGDGRVRLVDLPPPDDAEVHALARRVAARLTPIARRRLEEAGEDPRWHDSDRAAVLASHQEALRLPGSRSDGHDDSDGKPLCARVDGFSLHAARTVEPQDRAGLERLCRYGLRAPMSLDRLSIDQDGMVRCRLLRPWPTPEGRTDLVLDPVAFLRRVAALIPAPYANLLEVPRRLRHPLDAAAPPSAEVAAPQSAPSQAVVPKERDPDRPPRPRHLSWARLLRRVLDLDALTGPRCSLPMVVLAFQKRPSGGPQDTRPPQAPLGRRARGPGEAPAGHLRHRPRRRACLRPR